MNTQLLIGLIPIVNGNMVWQNLFDLIFVSIVNFQMQLSEMINEQTPDRIKKQVESLRKNQSLYNVINFFTRNFLLFLLILSFVFLFLVSILKNGIVTISLAFFSILILSRILKLNWERNQKIKNLYIYVADVLESTSIEDDLEDEKDLKDVSLRDEETSMQDETYEIFESRSDDIINIRDIIVFLEKDSRILDQIRTEWYQFWLPDVISYLNEYYGYPEEVIENRLDYSQKLFERVLISVVIGFAFLVIRSFPILVPNDQILNEVFIILAVLVFLGISLLFLSYPLIRYPALKKELLIWIKEHGFDMHLNARDLRDIPEIETLDESMMKKIQQQS